MFEASLNAAQTAIQSHMDGVLAELPDIPITHAMGHATRGGKRLRGFLVLEGARLHGIPADQAIWPACAIEALHAYSLVHDDLPCMDDDDLRRGAPTVHRKWDEATAVLAGDASSMAELGKGSPIVAIVKWDNSSSSNSRASVAARGTKSGGHKSTFYTITKNGVVEAWIKGEGQPKASLMALLDDQEDTKGTNGIEVLQASSADGIDGNDNDNKVLYVDLVVRMLRQTRSRIYWIRLVIQGSDHSVSLSQAVFLNGFLGSISCAGLTTAANGVSYGTFQFDDSNDAGVLVGLNADSIEPRELALPISVGKVLATERDVVTHGCCLFSDDGTVIRARYVRMQPQVLEHQQAQRQRKSRIPSPASSSLAGSASGGAASSVNALTNHLRSSFWRAYKNSSSTIQLSASLQEASPEDMEAAILLLAEHLQKETDAKEAWHKAFLDMLKNAGEYRKLSVPARWQLLGIGQEYAVHNVSPRPLDTYQIANKLSKAHQHALDHAPTELAGVTAWLVAALEAARKYRDTNSRELYDAFTDPCRLWTHSGEMQVVLKRQLEAYASGKVPRDAKQVAVIVKAALLSFQETNHPDYEPLKMLAIPLLEKDIEAFLLSKEHSWYEGLCRLSLKHIDQPTVFGLEPLLRNDPTMGRFVLQWHTDRDLPRLVFRYGALLPPNEFDAFLAETPKLRPHRWMHAVNTGRFDQATNMLMAVGQQRGTSALESQFALSMAKLTCKVAEAPADVSTKNSTALVVTDHDDDDEEDGGGQPKSKRMRMIDAGLDVAAVQRTLLDDAHQDKPLLPIRQLLQMAFDKLATSADPSEMAMIALALAKAELETNDNSSDLPVQVWTKIIRFDWDTKWSLWLDAPVPSDTILAETLFGTVWKEMQEQSVENHAVQFDDRLETPVLRLLGLSDGNNIEMKRMLRSVVTIDNMVLS